MLNLPDLNPSTRQRKIAPIVLPKLGWVPTNACGSRSGAKVTRVVVHRWGVKVTVTSPAGTRASYKGVISEFTKVSSGASAHIVMPGGAVPGRATQMVRWSQKAWTEATYNPTSVEIECADAIWLGEDPHGLQVTARMVAYLLHKYHLPANWSAEKGFCRHADLGVAGGDHLQCPTTDMAVWRIFTNMVAHEVKRGGFRSTWGRE